MMMPLLNGLPPGLRSMIEKHPQMRLSTQACLKQPTSGPSSVHMMSGLVSMLSPCSAYSGNTTRSMVERLRRAFATTRQIRSACLARSSLVTTEGFCSCTKPITTPSGDLFRPPSPLIRCSRLERVCRGGHASCIPDRRTRPSDAQSLIPPWEPGVQPDLEQAIGKEFDPTRPEEYLRSFAIRRT